MAPTKTAAPPRLRHIASLWTLWEHPNPKREWSLERKVAAVAEAGFDGFGTSAQPAHFALAQKFGLQVIGFISSGKASEFRSLIQRNLDGGAAQINVQLADDDTPLEKALALAIRIIELGDALGARCSIETHRDTCTETPEKFYALAAAFRRVTGRLLPTTWDHSHFAVVKHLSAPFGERLLVAPRLLQRSNLIHFRPFNGHHCQVPVTNGQGGLSAEFKDWQVFLRETLALWLRGAQTGRELFVVPEMGPVRGGYNLAQLPSSWADAQRLRGIIEKEWKGLVAPS